MAEWFKQLAAWTTVKALVAAGLGGYLLHRLIFSETETNTTNTTATQSPQKPSTNTTTTSMGSTCSKDDSKDDSIGPTITALPPSTHQAPPVTPIRSSKISSPSPNGTLSINTSPSTTPTTPTTATRTVVRAAFDVGSGATKFAVATVSSDLRVGLIRTEDNREVLLKHSMVNQILPPSALTKCFRTLSEYVERAKDCGAEEYVGVATAVFREAKNGPEFLDKVRAELGINIFVASQLFEGRLGYRTALIASNSTKEKHRQRTPTKRKQRQVLSWDSGGGSFQIANSCGGMYGGRVGSSTALSLMMQLQGRAFHGDGETSTVPSANPCTLLDCERLSHVLLSHHLPKVTEGWLRDLSDSGIASGTRVVAIGGDTCAFNMCQIATGGHRIFSSVDVWDAIVNHVGMDDDMLRELSFPQPEMLLPKLVLVYTVMVHVGMSEVEYHPTTGSTLGLLSTEMVDIVRERERDQKNRENGEGVVGVGEYKLGVL